VHVTDDPGRAAEGGFCFGEGEGEAEAGGGREQSGGGFQMGSAGGEAAAPRVTIIPP
jgi:hypothetical protein